MSDSPPPRRPTYDGGIPALLEQMEARRDPLVYGPGEALPPLDVDLGPLKEDRVLRPAEDPDFEAPATTYARKRKALRREFQDAPEICYLNGMLIANLRRREAPAHCAPLFRRLWSEEARFLIDHLDPRWLVSSITTFGDHGGTEVQRRVGSSLSVLFNTMKLYESERLYSGRGADTPFTLRGRAQSPLPLEMDRFALENGGLDVNMLGRLWLEAAEDAVIRPLAHHLLTELIHDPYNVFRRLRRMRVRKERQQAKREAARDVATSQPASMSDRTPEEQTGPRQVTPAASALPRWGIVTMTNAAPEAILGFVAHHLELGAAHVALYLDGSDPGGLEPLAAQPAVSVTLCDDAWWQAQPRPRMDEHQLRQGHCATLAYDAAPARGLDWIAHIDTDEFLLPEPPGRDDPVAKALATIAPDRLCARAVPVEGLAPLHGTPPRYFKRLPDSVGQPKSVMEDIAPDFGQHLRKGFLSHTSGKVFARTGLGRVRLGIHALKIAGKEKDHGAPLEGVLLGHCHSPGWDHFRETLEFRLAHGSYRKRDASGMKLHDILAFLREDAGEEGLRRLYAELCEARPEVLERFRAHGLLLDHPIDPQAAATRVFGAALRKAGE
ncbi:glycosyltransferase family 2 protein [Aquicoccus sp. SCR17]|nr:glycosyltransferase family 2 protein [Carideicomes alvinocaridis]